MKMKRIFLCDESLEGIFTAIYDAWMSQYGHEYIKISESKIENLELFTEYIKVTSDQEKAFKVASAIRNKISDEAYGMVYRASLSHVSGKGDAIYRFLIQGFRLGSRITEHLSCVEVNEIFIRNRNVNNEVLHYLGFVRFFQLKNTILFARIRPQNDILTLIAPHFSERLATENWMIYDESRQIAVIHRAGFSWVITPASDLDQDQLKHYSDDEERMQALWMRFTTSISIASRENSQLQRQNLPKRYREFMPEFLGK